MKQYLNAALDAVRILFELQSLQWNGRSDGVKCIVTSRLPFKSFRSIGAQSKGDYFTFAMKESHLEMQPYRLDMRIWPALELLSEVTGNPIYRENVSAIAREFCRDGFDSLSGLPYLGEMAEFDVRELKPRPAWGEIEEFYFKPNDSVPLEPLWEAAPKAMAQLAHSMFYGLIQREQTMEFNRFCEYGFDAAKKQPCREFHSNHHGTAYAGAYLIHWWSFIFARTGDAEVLGWIQAMAKKWKDAQHPVTGLLPAWFGSDKTGKDHMPAQVFCNNWDCGTAISYLYAARELKQHPQGEGLGKELEDIGLRLISGMARYGYDPKRKRFPQWINLDGSRRAETTWYTFASQRDREEEAKVNPLLDEVYVFSDSGFYESIRPWILQGGNPLPYNVALAAKMTGDPYLLAKAKEFAADIMEESSKLTGEFNAQFQWMYPANASYIKALLLVYELTGDKRHLISAQELADKELEALSQPLPPDQPEWWRMYFRHLWIEALLLLYKTLNAEVKRG